MFEKSAGYKIRVSGHICSESKVNTATKDEQRFEEILQPYLTHKTDPGSSCMYEEIYLTDRKTGHKVKIQVMVDTANSAVVSEIAQSIKSSLNLR